MLVCYELVTLINRDGSFMSYEAFFSLSVMTIPFVEFYGIVSSINLYQGKKQH